ncbi:DUF2316 family protein [Streptococcus sp. DD12]|uniref:DUF2316 family protein n=1 Tax=Streptococcus sp. DD12 TaxID=1777880 RepID=UPI00079595D6|nr:DUF2316 family protein [Streptococcus sp. DD12]KXT76856.1 hypothetical protein STRDD12_00261 [Streptococcus sp. DD12]
MLSKAERLATQAELAENFKRLGASPEQVAHEMGISITELKEVLAMSHPNPAHVWMLRDYLEDKLLAEGKVVYPFSKLADHSANRWFRYDHPWRQS